MVVTGLLLLLTQARNPRIGRRLAVEFLAVAGIIVVAVTLIEPSEDHLRFGPQKFRADNYRQMLTGGHDLVVLRWYRMNRLPYAS